MPVKNVLASTARSWETRADDAAPAAEPPRGERAPVGGAGLRAAAGLPRCAVPRPSTRFRNESKSGLASPSFFLPDFAKFVQIDSIYFWNCRERALH